MTYYTNIRPFAKTKITHFTAVNGLSCTVTQVFLPISRIRGHRAWIRVWLCHSSPIFLFRENNIIRIELVWIILTSRELFSQKIIMSSQSACDNTTLSPLTRASIYLRWLTVSPTDYLGCKNVTRWIKVTWWRGAPSEVRFRAVCRLPCFASRGKNVEGFICAKIFLLN
jgi:hypothetical protein